MMKNKFLMMMFFITGLTAGPAALFAQPVMGTVTQSAQVLLDLRASGMVAGLPDIPVNTEVRITNDSNARTITVNVVERMARNRGRVVNLSEDAARELGVKRGDWVRVNIPNLTMPVQPTGQSTVTDTRNMGGQNQNPSGNIIINNYYIFDAERFPHLAGNIFDQSTGAMQDMEHSFIQQIPPQESAISEQGFNRLNQQGTRVIEPEIVTLPAVTAPTVTTPAVTAPAVTTEPAVATPAVTTEPTITVPPIQEPETEAVIVGLPVPDGDNIYRLQVGTFSDMETALEALYKIQLNGYSAELEQAGGDVYRVYAADITAQDAETEAQNLIDLGFRQIWIRGY